MNSPSHLNSYSTSNPHADWESKLKRAQDLTTQATQQEFSSQYSLAQTSYTKAAELYVWLVRNFSHKSTATNSTSLYNGASNDTELRSRITKACEKVLKRAEMIREKYGGVGIVRDRLSEEEQSRVLSLSSKINGVELKPWSDPLPELLSSDSSLVMFNDPDGQPTLCPTQISQQAIYSRSHRSGSSSRSRSTLYDETRPLRGRDIVQDVVTDCSFVAALEVAAEHDRRWGTKLAASALYPQSPSGIPISSTTGRHALKLFINGLPREVPLDDSLPTRPSGELVCASSSSSSNPQYWPALIEKGYLKVMGGYDFPGSNSSIDLHALTNWIPEQIWLTHAGFQREKSWKRLSEAWKKGECMITAGTGKGGDFDMNGNEHKDVLNLDLGDGTKLIPSHDYAILEIREYGNRREVTLMNPWRRAPPTLVAIGTTAIETTGRDLSAALAPTSNATTSIQPSASPSSPQHVFTISWDTLCSHFHSLYLNWNPSIFRHSITAHSSWRKESSATPSTLTSGNASGTSTPTKSSAASASASSSLVGQIISQNPQFRLSIGETKSPSISHRPSTASFPSPSQFQTSTPPRPSAYRSTSTNSSFKTPIASAAKSKVKEDEIEVWLLLVRHIKRKEAVDEDKNEFIALHVFEHNEKSSPYSPRSSVKLGTYVDGTHNLIRFKASNLSPSYTLVVSRHRTSSSSLSHPTLTSTAEEEVGFTLSAYSQSELSLSEMPRKFPFRQKLDGYWKGRTAGGNVSNPTFMDNPQFSITIPPSSTLTPGSTPSGNALLSTPSPNRRPNSSSGNLPSTPTASSSTGSSILVLLEAPKDLPIQILLAYTSNSSPSKSAQLQDQRVSRLVEGDVVASSGAYHHGVAVLETSNLNPGTYTLIISSFEPGRLGQGPYSLTLDSETKLKMGSIPLEGAGMYHRTLKGEWDVAKGTACGSPSNSRNLTPQGEVIGSSYGSGSFDRNPIWLIKVGASGTSSLTDTSSARFLIRLHSILDDAHKEVRPYINASIFSINRCSSSDYTLSQELFSSGPYDDHVSGVSVDFKNSLVGKGEYALILSTFKPGWQGRFRVEVYSDKSIDCERIR